MAQSAIRILSAVGAACIIATGCSTSPVTGRAQLDVLAEPIQAAFSDIKFELFAAPRLMPAACGRDDLSCGSDSAAMRLAHEIERATPRLSAATAQLAPELAARTPRIEVFVTEDEAPGASSSPSGKIAIHSGVAALGLNEETVAFVISREIGRLAHAHHREAASAGVTASLATNLALANTTIASLVILDFLAPWSAIVKFVAALGSSATAQTAVERSQQDEADEFACRLMETAGYALDKLGVAPSREPGNGWTRHFEQSRQKALIRAANPTAPPTGLVIAVLGEPPEPSPF